MCKRLLKTFFQRNRPNAKTPSAQELAHFMIRTDHMPEVAETMEDFMGELLRESPSSVMVEGRQQQKVIEAAETCADLLRIMRQGVKPINQRMFIKRALVFEQEIVPEAVRRLKTSLSTPFIETAILLLAKTEMDIVPEILDCYHEMRNPYAQSLLLVVLGFKLDPTHIPWLIEQYEDLKRHYPDEDYYTGAYCALSEIGARWDLL